LGEAWMPRGEKPNCVVKLLKDQNRFSIHPDEEEAQM
jgi:hypothetical protein